VIKLSDVRHLHLELSSDCNARCPQCPRNFYGYPYNFGYDVTNLTLEKIKSLLPLKFVAQLDEILINGNYGDFVMNPESLDIVAWFREHNPTMKIDISTNGGARDKEFWAKLAEYKPVVSFCIDGLEDTHAIYRQNTIYETVIKNAATFMDADGIAVWCMTEFDHNLHQFEQAEHLSKTYGFKAFNRRPSVRNQGPVYDKQGNRVFVMKQVSDRFPEKIDDEFAQKNRFKPITSEYKPATCEALEQKSLYISAEGTIDPCCHVGMNKPKFTWWDKDIELRQGTFSTSLEEGISWFNRIEESFDTDQQMAVCSRVCGK
jgi:MoaA/NifB/PqqE/SkfB family radical SAM enzyme